MLEKRSRYANRPFYLIHPKTGLDSIFVIWEIKGKNIPFRQAVPNGKWIAMDDLGHSIASHAFYNVCVFFEGQLAVQMEAERLDRKTVRDRAWQKFKDNYVSSRLLKIFHEALTLAKYSASREGKWLTRLEIGMLYALNPYIEQRRWENAYSLWYPDAGKRIASDSKKGFKSSEDAWQDLKMLGKVKLELDEKADQLNELRKKLGQKKLLFAKGVITGNIALWRLGVAALYLVNPIVMRNGDILFLLDIWEDDYYTLRNA